MVSAIILAGGLGTRLAAAVPYLPKALAPIQGTPFLQLLLGHLSKTSKISQVIFALGYRAENIQSYLQEKNFPFQIDYSIETSPLGTGGALILALSKAKHSTLLVLNGDTFCDLSIEDFYQFHIRQAADLSIACREVEDVSRYGSVEIDPSLRICAFLEKSPHLRRGWINAGVYLIQKELLSSFPSGAYSIEHDFFPNLLKKRMFAYPHKGVFLDIGTPDSYGQAQELLKPWTIS